MKRDLASVLEGQSQLADSVVGTRAEEASPTLRVYERLNSKRFKGAIVDGLIVYTRARKPGINGRSGLSEDAKAAAAGSTRLDEVRNAPGFESDQLTEVVVRDEGSSGLVIPRSRGGKGSEIWMPFVGDHDIDGELVEVVVREEGNCSFEMSRKRSAALNGRAANSRKRGKDSQPRSSRRKRFTRSTLRPSVEPPLENGSVAVLGSEALPGSEAVTGLEIVPVEAISDVEEEKLVEVSTLLSNSKLELKMSKKVVLDRKPTTVKELFDTGLVDGVTVIYMGSKKAFGLRGTIRDGGILCSCISCNGCRVIPPSQFEIHACKTYRRAAQYICLENGRSLLDLLKVCRNASLHTLEATIQKFINSSPIDKYFTCKNCSVSFPPYCALEDGSLCYSCMESNKPHSPSQESSKNLRALLPASLSMSPKNAKSPKTATPKSARNGILKTPKSTILRPPRGAISKSPKSAILNSTKRAISKLPKSAISKSPKSASLWKTTKLSTPVSISSPSKSASPMRSEYKSGWKITSKSSKSVLISRSPSAASMYFSSQKKSQWRITTKDQRLHKLVFEEGGLPDGSEVAYYARGQKLLVGYKKGFGIFCRCCNTEVSPSQFEAHAGWATRRKPYAYIYTSNGVSLHELAISLSRGRKYSAKDNDDLCIICADGGNLVLCDGCPRAFHRDCASLSGVPRGDWYCKFCQNMFQREKFVEHNENAVAAGRVEGIDPIEQITQRCIRIVKDIEAELTGCVLCRGYDFSKSGFGPRTIILCDQCEKEYHVGCLKKHKMANLKELPKGKWFCCTECNKIQSILQKCLSRGAEELPDSHLDIMKRKHEENGLETVNGFDVRWRLISGKMASQESRLLLSKAVAIFHDCFDPIIDAESGRDLIPAMVYGRNVRSQEYGGMYCAILMVNSTVVSAAIIRVFGQEVAELPLVATSSGNHGKGYFQSLFSCIEKLLAFLSVKNLVLPAAPEAESIWTEKFGFTKIDPDQLINYRRTCYQMITFKGTSMLHKKVPECRLVNTA
ncbi:putative histone acetyltransferase chromatin regulator PHD family [Rosa chinensis]|uniref:Putative histone acetyltransferase chromatin regulator PHD family n=1 Tax=Rosa chinensis TaxID=74649 RepID=A0A2P6RB79_ROSCH|nr:uncharacterized protein LOC112193226 [Rosa chinensis]PRQ43692.1 putative histone acetyltransferase chromatin regulator PHD family [Rosa chinensis]